MQQTYGLDGSDRFLLKTSLNFDPSVWEVFWPLMVGAGVVVARAGGQHDGAYLVETMIEQGVTSVYFVPSMLRVFLETKGIERAQATLRRVICGGESLPMEMVEQFFARLGDTELHHSYGPTETSIAATEWTCTLDGERSLRVAPIGRPLANTETYVLDAGLRPVPVGVTGELFIGGEALGRGYLHRPHLTAEKFIPHSFSARPGARLYRTGDKVRYRPDGNIEFIGRVDNQVKVRGYRIETGEIEAVLNRHALVDESVVVALGETAGEKQLIAYVVAGRDAGVAQGGEGELSIRELRRHLKEQLPDYMIPSAFVMLDGLPLMPSGKVDRKALPAPGAVNASENYAAPRTPAEELMTGIWQEVLGVERLGIDDDFFESGGHSLLATQVSSRVRETFRTELSLRELFEKPTIRELTESVQASIPNARAVDAMPMQPVSRAGDLPLSFGQQRLWFLHQLEPDSYAYNIPMAVRLSGPLQVEALERVLNEVARRHEILRTTFVTMNGLTTQLIAPHQAIELPFVDLCELTAEEREVRARERMLEQLHLPFDLTRGPLLRTTLLRLGGHEHILVLTIHHIVADAWSMSVLVGEMATLYESFAGGRPSPLPELPFQYADYAYRQRQWLRGEVLETQLAYWRRQLGDDLPVIKLPTDRAQTAVESTRGATQSFRLNAADKQALKSLSRRQGVTLFMTLLATFKTLLHHYSGEEDIVIGSPIAGRNRAEVEGLIGFFVNALVLRTSLSGDPGFYELLARVREVALGAYAHQDVPFEKLVEELRAGRDRTRSPLFQVAFTLDNTPRQSLDVSGLTLTTLPIESEATRFNLVIALTETEEGLFGSFQYNTDIFNASTIARMLRHYGLLLRFITAEPNARLTALNKMLDEADRQEHEAKQKEFKEARGRMLKNAKQRPVRQASNQGELVK
jgi:non-ribosomal peptide synthetase component F/acyl carrier protein